MQKRTLLWVDLSLRGGAEPATTHFEDFFVIEHAPGRTGLGEMDMHPDALCFDFDFPDRVGLQFLQRTKSEYPSIPILMLTVQHSEALAVWAFRARVWDYFRKPVSRADVERCYESMMRIPAGKARRSVRITPPVPRENATRSLRPDVALLPALEYVKAHLGEKLSERRIAATCGMSSYRFSRAFRAAFGETFQQYVVSLRLERARELLKNPQLQVSEVAFLVGFRDVSYFGKVFRRYHSMTPSQWQAAWQGGAPEPLPDFTDTPCAEPA